MNDFIGSTNNQDLVFKTNNSENLRVTASGGYFGIGTSAPSAILDVKSTGTVKDHIILS